MPYSNQSETPHVKAIYIPSEMSCVCLVRHTCQTCGMNDMVVKVAARLPIKLVAIIIGICMFVASNFSTLAGKMNARLTGMFQTPIIT